MKRAARTIITSDHTTIYYEISQAGTKPTLVLLHGLGGDLTAWDKERTELESHGYRTLAIDLRGHGLSGHPTEKNAYRLSRCAQDVLDIIHKEHVSKPILVGHCFGGMVALTLLGMHQHLASALVLIDTSYKPPYFAQTLVHHDALNSIINPLLNYLPTPYLGQHVDFSKYKGTGDYDVSRILSDIMHTSLKSYLLISENLTNYDATTLLSKIVVPTLVIEGEDDSIFPPAVAKALVSRIKHAEIHYIKGGNHIVVINNPKAVDHAILTFIRPMSS